MKVDVTQFIYNAQLPNGSPLNLNISVVRDGNYEQALRVWISMLAQAQEDFKKELGVGAAS